MKLSLNISSREKTYEKVLSHLPLKNEKKISTLNIISISIYTDFVYHILLKTSYRLYLSIIYIFFLRKISSRYQSTKEKLKYISKMTKENSGLKDPTSITTNKTPFIEGQAISAYNHDLLKIIGDFSY